MRCRKSRHVLPVLVLLGSLLPLTAAQALPREPLRVRAAAKPVAAAVWEWAVKLVTDAKSLIDPGPGNPGEGLSIDPHGVYGTGPGGPGGPGGGAP